LPREKVLAAVVRLLEATLIRVGNEEYAKSNNSYGLTTMLDRHAKVSGEKITFEFKGKSNKRHHIDVRDRQLAKIVKQCQELPDQEISSDSKSRVPRPTTETESRVEFLCLNAAPRMMAVTIMAMPVIVGFRKASVLIVSFC